MTGSYPVPLPTTVETDQEAQWIEQARLDPQAFAALYRRYLNPVYRYLAARVGDPRAAEDLTAQVFLAVWTGLPAYRHEGHFAAWLFSIARRHAADYYRKQSHALSLETLPDLPDPLADPLKAFIQENDRKQIAGIFRELSEEERELIRLRFLADLSFAEMALLLKRKESAVKMALYRLLARIERELEVAHDR
jgi:RNA polymerase sigma-70 factor (ECF subfamily)